MRTSVLRTRLIPLNFVKPFLIMITKTITEIDNPKFHFQSQLLFYQNQNTRI